MVKNPGISSLSLLLLAAGTLVAAEPSEPITLRDGDRVVLLGDAFVERMQAYGYFESLVTVAQADRRLEFRNLGWSGDTVHGIARAVFGTPNDGFSRLEKDLRAAEPDVLLVHYGGNEAHRGPAGLEDFRAGLNRLLDMLQTTDARTIVLLSPHRRLPPPAPLPDPAEYNARLPAYCQVLREAAQSRNLVYVDLLDLLDGTRPQRGNGKTQRGNGKPQRGNGKTQPSDGQAQPSKSHIQDRPPVDQLTDNGIHLSESGYRWVAPRLAKRLGLAAEGLPDPDQLPAPLPDQLADQLTELREAIRWKNELFFHRYRPQNETYLFLFRKHEQGNNAAEIPQFDPLILKAESRIHQLALAVAEKWSSRGGDTPAQPSPPSP